MLKNQFQELQLFETIHCSGASVSVAFFFQLLEQALKTYPASTPERWDRIAESVSTRTKKECMKRYKVKTPSFR